MIVADFRTTCPFKIFQLPFLTCTNYKQLSRLAFEGNRNSPTKIFVKKIVECEFVVLRAATNFFINFHKLFVG